MTLKLGKTHLLNVAYVTDIAYILTDGPNAYPFPSHLSNRNSAMNITHFVSWSDCSAIKQTVQAYIWVIFATMQTSKQTALMLFH